jgi:hypothetical protein
LAARTIARDEGLGDDRLPALSALAQHVRQEFKRDPFLASQAQRVIFAEAFELFEHDKTPTAPGQSWKGDPATVACWTMRRRGLDRCPQCRRPIPDEDTLSRWEDLDRAAWYVAIAREGALAREQVASALAAEGDVA